MRKFLALATGVAALLAGLGSAGAQEEQAVPVRDSRAASCLVLAQEPARAAQLAAYELQWHVERITGAVLPILADNAPAQGLRILIGESEATKAIRLRNEGFAPGTFLVRVAPDAVILMGRDKDDRGKVRYQDEWTEKEGPAWIEAEHRADVAHYTYPRFSDDQGTMYAAYEFLEKLCGVRWFRPGEVGLYCPSARTLAVKRCEIRSSPGLRYLACDGFGGEVHMDHYDACLGLFTGEADKPRMDECERLAWEPLQKKCLAQAGGATKYLEARRREGRLFLHRRRVGGEAYAACHSITSFYPRFWERDERWDKEMGRPLFVEKRPAYFAQGYEGRPAQLCYTHPEVVRQLAEDARNFFDGKGPKLPLQSSAGDYFAVVPDDNGAYCKCPRCQSWFNAREAGNARFNNGRWSDYVFQVANAVAKELAKTHPDKYVSTLAYADYAYYPTKVRLEKNLSVQLCLHVRNWWAPAMEDNDRKMLAEWSQKEPGRRLFLWLYYTFPQENAMGGGWRCFPGFFGHTLAGQVRLFRQHGIRGVFFNGWAQDADAYLALKMFQDRDADFEQVFAEYFRLYYGAAAAPMKELYLAIEDAFSSPANYPDVIRFGNGHYHQTQELAWGCVGTEERMEAFARLMAKARAAARTDLEKRRVQLFEKGIWEYMVAGRRQYLEDLEKRAPSPPTRRANALVGPAPDGDLAKVDWSQAATLGPWRLRRGEPTLRKIASHVAHDGKWLYLRLQERIDPASLIGAGDLQGGDRWQLILASRRAGPWRELLVGPRGATAARTGGEKEPLAWDSGAKVVSDTTTDKSWTVCLALPLDKILPAGVTPETPIFLNVARRASRSGLGEPMWQPTFGEFNELGRLGQIMLQRPADLEGLVTGAPAEMLKQGLVGQWHLDEGKGSEARDGSGHNLTGSLRNDPAWSEGRLGKGLRMYGYGQATGQFVEIGDSPLTRLSKALTMAVWIEPTTCQGYPAIMGRGYEASGSYSLHIRPDMSVWFEMLGEDGKRYIHNPTEVVLEMNAWNHVAATYEGAVMRLFINGREVGQGKAVSIQMKPPAQPLRLGFLGSYGYFDGFLDEACLYNRALSPAEVHAIYHPPAK